MKTINTTILLVTMVMNHWVHAQEADVTVTVAGDQPANQISKHIYGHFAEHLGRCIYDGIYVGEDNTEIPHTEGVRNDIIDALKELQIPNLRWPGGCFADTYHWKDGIGPKDQRPTIVNRWWGGTTEDNSFGTHDFLNMCQALGAEPFLSANVGSGTVQELIDWVQYTNHDGVSPMADLRRQNGQEEPWNVRFWGVGNEAGGCGGHMTKEYYRDIYRKYATFMGGWSADQGIYRIAAGAFDGDTLWTEELMKNVPRNLIEAIGFHHYASVSWVTTKGPSVNYDEEFYFKVLDKAWAIDASLKAHIGVMDRYDPDNSIGLIVDEWGGWYDTEKEFQKGVLYQQNTVRDAIIAGMTLNIFNNLSDRIKMANLAQTVNVLQAVILTEGSKMLLTPTYHVMNMYKVHQDATLLPVAVSNADYAYGDQSIPAISASASRDANGATHISLTNADYSKSYEVALDLNGVDFKGITGQVLNSAKAQDYNSFDDGDKIKPASFKGFANKKGKVSVTMPAHSVVVLELK